MFLSIPFMMSIASLLLYSPPILFLPHRLDLPLYLPCASLYCFCNLSFQLWKKKDISYYLIFPRCTYLCDTRISLSDLCDLTLWCYILKVPLTDSAGALLIPILEPPCLSWIHFLPALYCLHFLNQRQHSHNTDGCSSRGASCIFLLGIVRWLFRCYSPKEI